MKGTYILFLQISKPLQIKIGKLGKIKFKKGKYVYIGSAQNGLEKRIERHYKKQKKKFWHIDYLTTNKFCKVYKYRAYINKPKSRECRLAERFSKKYNSIKGFGCSDCKCRSHLFYIF